MSNIIQNKRREAAALNRRTRSAAQAVKAGGTGYLAALARQGGVPEEVTLTPAATLQLGKQEAAQQIMENADFRLDTMAQIALSNALEDSASGAEKAFDAAAERYRKQRDDTPRSQTTTNAENARRRAHSAKLMRRMAEERLERRLEENARIAYESECAASKARLRVRLSGGRQAEILAAHAVDAAGTIAALDPSALLSCAAAADTAAAALPTESDE